jgi:hypothetical protein
MLWNGNECGKKKCIEISRQQFPLKIMIGKNN